MTSRILIIAALSAALAVCLYLFLGGEESVSVIPLPAATPSPAAQSAAAPGKNPASQISSDGTGKKTAVDWERFSALLNMDASGDGMIPEVTAEDIARFLAKRGETAVNLVAAFEKTHDRRWLERALELFPNSPVILMTAVNSVPASPAPKPGETYQPDAQRTAFTERFKAADPNNPLPWIFSAQELFKAKLTGEAVAEIRAALERPAFYTYANERMDSTQQLYEDLGLHPIEAAVLAMASQTIPHTTAAMQSSRSLMEWQKSATDSGDTAAAADAIQLSYNLGRTFATPEASRTLLGQLVGVAMEARALKALPADAQPDWLSVTPAQRLAEMEKQKLNVTELTAGLEWILQSQDEQLLAEYLRRNRTDGELSALTWLKAQRK